MGMGVLTGIDVHIVFSGLDGTIWATTRRDGDII